MATREETVITNIPDSFIRDESKKLAKKVEAKQNSINDIINELNKLRIYGIFPYINKIQPLDFLYYIVIILTFILLSNYIPITLKHVVGLLIGICFVYYLQEGKRATVIDKLKTTEIMMESIIPRPSFFYIDANLIEFAYNMMSYRKYNTKAFSKMVEAIDHLLQIRMDIENPALQNCTETFQVAMDMKNTALNELHSIIHSVPTDEEHILETKLLNAVKTLQLFLQRHLDEMTEICNTRTDAKGWNISTKRIDKYAIPGYDKLKNPKYHLF